MSLLKDMMAECWNIHLNGTGKTSETELSIEMTGMKKQDNLPFPIRFDIDGNDVGKVLDSKDNEQLTAMLQAGWSLLIECKGKHREYGMTYEGSGRKNIPNYAHLMDYHATGDTLSDLFKDFIEQDKEVTKSMAQYLNHRKLRLKQMNREKKRNALGESDND